MFLLGCGKDGPIEPEPVPPIVYPVRSTPKNAVRYMVTAFVGRDSVRTDSVYADDYEGSSIDLTDPNPTALAFTKADEVRVVGAMRGSVTLIRADMNFGPSESWAQTHDGSDPVGWVSIQVPSYDIYIIDDAGDYRVQAPSPGQTQIFEFTLKPTTPDASSPTDTTWTIVRWVESRAQN